MSLAAAIHAAAGVPSSTPLQGMRIVSTVRHGRRVTIVAAPGRATITRIEPARPLTVERT